MVYAELATVIMLSRIAISQFHHLWNVRYVANLVIRREYALIYGDWVFWIRGTIDKYN
jgi:hypothetical protein